MTIYILLTTPSTDAGPFNLYSDVTGYVIPFGLSVSKAELLGGYVTTAPDGTTIVRIVSVGDCTNSIEVAVGEGPIPTTTTTTTNPLSLELVFDDISNANTLVGDASNVADWNTFFDLPTYGNVFTSVNVIGNTINLYGGSSIIIKEGLFSSNENIIEVNDNINSIIEVENDGFFAATYLQKVYLPSVIVIGDSSFEECYELALITMPQLVSAGYGAFYDCIPISIDFPSLTTVGTLCFAYTTIETANLPQLTTIGNRAFRSCDSLVSINIPSCTSLGTTTGNDEVFLGISGNVINLTVPSALMTNNSGNPDGDIQYLQANNTVTITTV